MNDEHLVDEIQMALNSLPYREREIIKLRYGMGDGLNYSLEEVAHIFRVTRERIGQLEKKAIEKLKSNPQFTVIGQEFESRKRNKR